MFLFNEVEIFHNTGIFTSLVKVSNMLKNIIRFTIKLIFEGSNKSFTLCGAIGGTEKIAEGTGVERNHNDSKDKSSRGSLKDDKSRRLERNVGSLT